MNQSEEISPSLGEVNRWVVTALAEKLEEVRSMNEQLHESNGRAMAALVDRVHENQRTELELIRANSKAIGDLISSLDKLQSGQMSMAQILSEKQSIFHEFREIITTILERSERYQTETCYQIELIGKEVMALQRSFLQMQQDLYDMLKEMALQKQAQEEKEKRS